MKRQRMFGKAPAYIAWVGVAFSLIGAPASWWQFLLFLFCVGVASFLTWAKVTVPYTSHLRELLDSSRKVRELFPPDMHDWFDYYSAMAGMDTTPKTSVWTTSDLIPLHDEGVYQFGIEKAWSGESSNGTPFLTFTAKFLDGAYKGDTLKKSVYLSRRTEAGMRHYYRQIANLGVVLGGKAVPPAHAVRLLPDRFTGRIKHEEYNGVVRDHIEIMPFRPTSPPTHDKHCDCCSVSATLPSA